MRELNSLYPKVDIHARQFDASNEEAVKAVVDEAMEKYRRLDILFANAAIVGTNQVFWDIEAEDFIKTIRTNVVRYLPNAQLEPSMGFPASNLISIQCFPGV